MPFRSGLSDKRAPIEESGGSVNTKTARTISADAARKISFRVEIDAAPARGWIPVPAAPHHHNN
jgi:hypothetical protein